MKVKRLKGDALRKLQQQVLERDEHRCVVCWTWTEAPPHHIIYKSQGGRDVAENLITLCRACHTQLHDGGAHPIIAHIRSDIGAKTVLEYIFRGMLATPHV